VEPRFVARGGKGVTTVPAHIHYDVGIVVASELQSCMPYENQPAAKYSLSDKLAIALACLAGIMTLIVFLIEKTPLTVALSLGSMIALGIYPILHFIRKSLFRVIWMVCMMAGTLAFGWYVWPKEKKLTTTAESSVTTNPAATKPDPPFEEQKAIVNSLMDEYRKIHAESATDEWINQQLKLQGYMFKVATTYEGSVNPDPSKPPIFFNNYGKMDHVTLLGGGMNNAAGAQASYIRADLRPWFAFILQASNGELKEETHQKIEAAIKKKRAEIKKLPPDQCHAQLESLDAIAQQLRAVEYNPEKVRLLLQQWKLDQ